MTAPGLLRLLGAGIAGLLLTTHLLAGREPCGNNGLRDWLLICQPVMLAQTLSLPRPNLGSYFKHGSAAVLGIAVAAGIYGSGVEPPRSCELLYGGADGYFIFWGVSNYVLLVVGAIPVLLVLLAIKDFPLLARRFPRRLPEP
jgi:hypothetical protein